MKALFRFSRRNGNLVLVEGPGVRGSLLERGE
jgi:hypothetical protein